MIRPSCKPPLAFVFALERSNLQIVKAILTFSPTACLSVLLGCTCLTAQPIRAQTLFTDVTLLSLGNVTHSVGNLPGVRINTGAAWFDYDRDGDLDLYMTNRAGANHLWRNDGGGVFVDVAADLGVADASHDGSGVAVADFDNDGDLDMYLANGDDDVFFKNLLTETGTATFIDVTATAFPGITTPQRGATPSWGDYDKDGYLDLYVANHKEIQPGTGVQDRLFHNNGDGTFTDVSYLLGLENLNGYGFIAAWTDYDKDGDLDIFLINDCPYGPLGTKLFRNDGGSDPLTWTFTEVSESVGVADCRNGMGIAVGDYDRDSWLDYFYTNITSPLLLHNGGGTFTDVTAAAGLDYTAREPNFTLALATLTARLKRRSLIVLFSDFADPTSAELMVESVERLVRHHVVIFVTMEDAELADLTEAEPARLRDLATAVAADALARQRALVLQRLRRLGVDVIEAPWQAVGYRLIDRYLAAKQAEAVG